MNAQPLQVIEYGWSAYDPDVPSETRDNGDPIGLRAWATRVTRRLVPIFTPQHRTLWGFAWLCAGRWLAGEVATVALPRDEAWLRLEATWVHAQTRHALHGSIVPSWPGRRRAESQAQLKRLRVDETSRLLKHQLTQGSWGAYRKGATRLGLVRAEGFGTGFLPSTAGLSGVGRELSDWFLESFLGASGHELLLQAALEGQVDAVDLAKIPPADRSPDPKLGALIGGCVPGAEIGALRRTFDTDLVLFPSVMDLQEGSLTSGQQDALRSAKAVRRLVEGIEFDYRAWMLGDSPPESTLWEDDEPWARAIADQEAEVLELRAAGRAHGWQGAHRWQQDLAMRRGSRPQERYEVPESYAERHAPSFGLPSIGGLFAEGLLGERQPDWWQVTGVSDEEPG